MNNNCYVKLPNNWYDNLDIANEEITLLILLYRNYMQYKSIGVCSLEALSNCMYINTNSNKKITNIFKDTITSLIEKEYILNLYNLHYEEITVDNIASKNYTFYVELIPPPDNNYFMIKDIDIDKIFNHLKGVNLDKFSVIRYFVACRRVTSNEGNFGYLTQGKLKQLINHSITIQRYNKILQDDLNLIRYNNDFLTKERHYCTTFIGLYDNKASFDKLVNFEVERQGLVPTDKVKSNNRRSVKQKINVANKGNDLNIKDAYIKQLEEKLEVLQYKDKAKEDKEIYELVNDLSESSQDDDQMNPTDIMPEIIVNMDEDDISVDIPESLKITKQLQDEDKLIDILSIGENDDYDYWGEPEPEAKKCIICREEYTETTTRKNWCQNCIDSTEKLNQRASIYNNDREYEEADSF